MKMKMKMKMKMTDVVDADWMDASRTIIRAKTTTGVNHANFAG